MLPKDINNITEPVYKRLHKEIEDVKESSSVVIEASSITALSDDELNALKVGDVVQKITGEQKHCYIVTYKQEEHGICLTYVDAGYMETVSYDYTDGHWVYNSTDVVEVKDPEAASSGVIKDVLGLNVSGELVKGAVSGGTKLYIHEIENNSAQTIAIISTKSTPYVTGDFSKIGDQSAVRQFLQNFIMTARSTESTANYVIRGGFKTSGSSQLNVNYQNLVFDINNGSFSQVEISLQTIVSDTVTEL